MENDKDCGTLDSGISNMEIADVILNADVPSESGNDVHSVGGVPRENAVNNVGIPSVVASSVDANANVIVNNLSSADSVPQLNNLDAGALSSAVVDGETYASKAARMACPADNALQ